MLTFYIYSFAFHSVLSLALKNITRKSVFTYVDMAPITVSTNHNKVDNVANIKIDQNNKYMKNIIPILHKKADHESIIKEMDKFTLNNIKTHFNNHLANTKHSRKENDILYTSDSDSGDYDEEEIKKINESQSENTNEAVTVSQETSKHTNVKQNTHLTAVNVTTSSIERIENSQERILFNILRKQMDLIEKLANMTNQQTPRVKVNEFDDLVKEMEIRQRFYVNSTFIEARVTTIRPKTTAVGKTSAVLMVFDEVQVRKALKNDPYVKRIMKMASKKRQNYVKKLKLYKN